MYSLNYNKVQPAIASEYYTLNLKTIMKPLACGILLYSVAVCYGKLSLCNISVDFVGKIRSQVEFVFI